MLAFLINLCELIHHGFRRLKTLPRIRIRCLGDQPIHSFRYSHAHCTQHWQRFAWILSCRPSARNHFKQADACSIGIRRESLYTVVHLFRRRIPSLAGRPQSFGIIPCRLQRFLAAKVNQAHLSVVQPKNVAQADIPVKISQVVNFLQCLQHCHHGSFGFTPSEAPLLIAQPFIHGTSIQILHQDVSRAVQVHLIHNSYYIVHLFLRHGGHNPGFLQESVGVQREICCSVRWHHGTVIRLSCISFRKILLDTPHSQQPPVISNIGNAISAPAHHPADDKPVVENITRL